LTFNDKSDLRIRRVSRADQHEKVLDQNPRAGQVVAKNSAIKLIVGRLASKKFVFKQLPQVKMMPGIKMSPAFIKREVEPAPE
jgi:beta-lactam-binding protein with PASTA domain